jgi:hypothetical protein
MRARLAAKRLLCALFARVGRREKRQLQKTIRRSLYGTALMRVIVIGEAHIVQTVCKLHSKMVGFPVFLRMS